MLTIARAILADRVLTRGRTVDHRLDLSHRLNRARQRGFNTLSRLSIARTRFRILAIWLISRCRHPSSSLRLTGSRIRSWTGTLTRTICRDCPASCSLGLRSQGRPKVARDRREAPSSSRTFLSSKRKLSPRSRARSWPTPDKLMSSNRLSLQRATRSPGPRLMNRCATTSKMWATSPTSLFTETRRLTTSAKCKDRAMSTMILGKRQWSTLNK